jgi:hypothetical protein
LASASGSPENAAAAARVNSSVTFSAASFVSIVSFGHTRGENDSQVKNFLEIARDRRM